MAGLYEGRSTQTERPPVPHQQRSPLTNGPILSAAEGWECVCVGGVIWTRERAVGREKAGDKRTAISLYIDEKGRWPLKQRWQILL